MERKDDTNLGKPTTTRQAVALEKIEEAIKAVEGCDGELTADGYKDLRKRLGHLMDALYNVGGELGRLT